VLSVHHWQLALFPLEAQEEVWGDDDSVLLSSSYAPTGQVERVDGGFNISGRWSFSSGCDLADWAFLGGFVPVPQGSPLDMRTFLVPKSDYRIDDNWYVAGLKASGSKDIVIEKAFVPEHRTHKLRDGFIRNSPGNEHNPAPLYRLPFGQIHVRSVSSPAIGAAIGALNGYLQVTRDKISAAEGLKVADDPTAQVVCSEAAATIDAARLVMHRNFNQMMEWARTGADMPIDQRVQYRYDSSRAVTTCVEATDQLFTVSGGRALFLGKHPVQRYFQDIHAIRAHFANGPDKPARNYGRVQLGMKNTDFFI
jgi:3-hydroxy-9,10-secoandrosta-1,3,5(10)-triene-9,17-dione monooxygenase